MTSPFARGLSKATELTRSGRVTEAMALIQSLMRAPSAAATPFGTMDAIAGACREIDAASVRRGAKAHRAAARSRLGETLRKIAAGGMPLSGGVTPAMPDLAQGAQMLSLTHKGAQGSRDYRLYVPGHRPEAAMPLIVMLHGCTQTPEDFAAGTGMNALAEEAGCLVAWPAQPQGANVQKCWNWFRPEDQGRDRGEPALLAGIVRDILRDYPADADRVYAAGLSAGGAAAAILGAAYPDLFAAVGVHSGLPVGGAQDVASAFAAMRSGSAGRAQAHGVPAIVFHGQADSTVHPGNGDAVVAQALQQRDGLDRVSVSGTSPGGRTYRQTRHDEANGRSIAEHWQIDGAGHAWSGGRSEGSYTDPTGPDASREMLRFFLQHRRE